MMGGSADVVSGGFDHVMVMRARGQKLRGFLLQGATPAIVLGVAKQRAAEYRSAKDLKGMKIGVSAPGSSTHAFVNHLLASVGLAADDVSIVGVGTGPTAVAAMQAGHLDAIANIEPAITMMEPLRFSRYCHFHNGSPNSAVFWPAVSSKTSAMHRRTATKSRAPASRI